MFLHVDSNQPLNHSSNTKFIPGKKMGMEGDDAGIVSSIYSSSRLDGRDYISG